MSNGRKGGEARGEAVKEAIEQQRAAGFGGALGAEERREGVVALLGRPEEEASAQKEGLSDLFFWTHDDHTLHCLPSTGDIGTSESLTGVSAAVLRAASRLGGAFGSIAMLREARPKKGQCAYVVQSELGLLKVGSSRDFAARWVGLRAMIPHELRLVAIWPKCTRANERAMHRALARWRVKGEWFRGDAGSLALVRAWIRRGPPEDDGSGRPPPVSTCRPPTVRQLQVLHFIHREIHTRGFAPSIREIGGALGIKSTNGVNDHLRALAARDLIQRSEDNVARGMVVTERGMNLVATGSAA